MRSIGSFLLLLTIGWSSSAPLNRHEKEARKFWGSIANNYQKGNNGELFDVIFAKFDFFFPGFVTSKDTKYLRPYFIEWQKGNKTLKLDKEKEKSLGDRLSQVFSERMQLSDSEETQQFMQEIFPQQKPGFRDFLTIVIKIKSKFAALSEPTKHALSTHLPIFARLDELLALVQVLDDILEHAGRICKNLDGFDECEMITQFAEYRAYPINN